MKKKNYKYSVFDHCYDEHSSIRTVLWDDTLKKIKKAANDFSST